MLSPPLRAVSITVRAIVVDPRSEAKCHEGGTVSVPSMGTVPISEQVFTKYLVANRPDLLQALTPRYGGGNWRWEWVEKE